MQQFPQPSGHPQLRREMEANAVGNTVLPKQRDPDFSAQQYDVNSLFVPPYDNFPVPTPNNSSIAAFSNEKAPTYPNVQDFPGESVSDPTSKDALNQEVAAVHFGKEINSNLEKPSDSSKRFPLFSADRNHAKEFEPDVPISTSVVPDKETSYEQPLNSPAPKGKKQRLVPEQLNYLLRQFAKDANPSPSVREEIARELNLPERSVTIWFQNRRAKAKLISRRQEEERQRLLHEQMELDNLNQQVSQAFSREIQSNSENNSKPDIGQSLPFTNPLLPKPTKRYRNTYSAHESPFKPTPSSSENPALEPPMANPLYKHIFPGSTDPRLKQRFSISHIPNSNLSFSTSDPPKKFPKYLSTGSFPSLSAVSASLPSAYGRGNFEHRFSQEGQNYDQKMTDNISSMPAIRRYSSARLIPSQQVQGDSGSPKSGSSEFYYFACALLIIGLWKRLRLTPQDLMCFYSPPKKLFAYLIQYEGIQYRIEYSFFVVESIHVNRVDDPLLTELNVAVPPRERPGANESWLQVDIHLTIPPVFHMITSEGQENCTDFTEGNQASEVLGHSLIGPASSIFLMLNRIREASPELGSVIKLHKNIRPPSTYQEEEYITVKSEENEISKEKGNKENSAPQQEKHEFPFWKSPEAESSERHRNNVVFKESLLPSDNAQMAVEFSKPDESNGRSVSFPSASSELRSFPIESLSQPNPFMYMNADARTEKEGKKEVNPPHAFHYPQDQHMTQSRSSVNALPAGTGLVNMTYEMKPGIGEENNRSKPISKDSFEDQNLLS
ncbi:homeobox transcription factor Phx1 [Schizosaccharomyces octosporus yFS286]|uniref:Homeobox transcription factor Phx1 n=1 Tax=Schizosaccharomyces octosporus (strain yFS286) TaxID=483514 RepID=S9PTA0_SCHOY|nr:homeobox transcription factor Phx1 [Schizosaccharomyces octosporus yFS286]EPX70728.1 homeobox transcription factor Phx1 [Schizosaccharomyces octosporus yFS286]